MNADLPPNLQELPEEGVVTCCGADAFVHLVLLCHSVRETYPVPVACFDTGLSADQRDWIAENLPTCTVMSVPGEPLPSSDESLRTLLVAASPFRRTCWVDPGLIVLGGLGELFTGLDYGPVLAGEAAVSGWDVERDASLLEPNLLPGELEDRVLDGGPWTTRSVPSDTLPDRCFRDVEELFEELRRTLSDVRIVRLVGEWSELDPLMRSVAARTPGRPRPRSGEPRSAVHLMSMIAAKSSPELVEAFLEHYYRLGVDSFLIALHSEPGDARSERIGQILRWYRIEPVLVTPVFSAAKKLRFYEQTARERCSPQDWVLYADVDELQVFPAPLAEVLETCDRLGHVFVQGQLVDRVADDGALVEFGSGSPVWEQFPFSAAVTGRLTAGWTGKVCAAKGWTRLGEGGAHTLDYGSDDPRNYIRTRRDPRCYPRSIEVHHFKWDAELARRTYEKIHALGGDLDSLDGPAFMPEYTALLEHFERFGGLAIDDLMFAGTPELHYVRASLAGLPQSLGVSQRPPPTVAGARRASQKSAITGFAEPAPVRSYLICASQRTGSNLLCELLSQTGVVGSPGEYFYPGGEELNCGWWGIEPGSAYLEEVVRRSTSADGVIGTKVMWPHLAAFVARLRASAGTPEATDLEALAYLLPNPRFIWLRREDTIAQAVSWAKAAQTGQWLRQQKRTRMPVFDYELIRFFAGRASVFEDEWRRWFERHEIAPFRISYEDLLADVSGSIGRILEFLEIPVPADLSAGGEPTLRQQRDQVNREWTVRYRQLEAAARPRAAAAQLSEKDPTDARAVHACTVVTRNRLAHARVLARSFLEHHRNGSITALLVDDVDRAVNPALEPFEVVHPEDTGLDQPELHRMATMYHAYEFVNSLKPWVIGHVLASGVPAVFYLDSDIWVSAPLEELTCLVDRHGLVLTPHMTEPPANEFEEPQRLIGGMVNAGFLGVGAAALPFLEWWRDRLSRACRLAPEEGFWTDQRWVNLALGYFSHHLLRDPGSNVATWNLSTRRLERTATGYRVNGSPLRFFHFARFDPSVSHVLDPGVAHVRPSREPAVAELCRMYAAALSEQGQEACSTVPYGFGTMPDGPPLDPTMRRLYREALLEAERGAGPEPPNPFTGGAERFLAWLNEPAGPPRARRRSRYLEAVGRDGLEPSSVPPELRPAARPTPPVAPPEPAEYLPGVNLLLRVGRAGALDDVGRRLAACLAEAEIPFTTVWWDETAADERDAFIGLHAAAAPYDTTIACLNPLDIGRFAYFVTPAFFTGRYTIGLWLDESLPAPDLDHAIGFLDEIWVGSEFAASGLGTRTDKPVHVAPIPVEPPTRPLEPARLPLPEGLHFLALADLGGPNVRGRYERANPLAAIRAFTRAFQTNDGAALLVRTVAGEDHIVELEELLLETSRSDVRVVDGPLAAEERSALIASCDCLISLHRAEEFGIAMGEAAAYGKPIVATKFSGNLAFLDGENAYLVDWEPAEIGVEEPSYWEQDFWAEPNLEQAAAQIRAVFEDPAEARRRADRGRAAVAERLSVRATAEFLRRRLAQSREPRTEPEPETRVDAPPTPLQRASAYVTHGPRNPWDAASRFGAVGRLGRRLLFRALRPYDTRHGELDAALVETLADLNHRAVQIEQRIEDLAELVRELKPPGSRGQ